MTNTNQSTKYHQLNPNIQAKSKSITSKDEITSKQINIFQDIKTSPRFYKPHQHFKNHIKTHVTTKSMTSPTVPHTAHLCMMIPCQQKLV